MPRLCNLRFSNLLSRNPRFGCNPKCRCNPCNPCNPTKLVEIDETAVVERSAANFSCLQSKCLCTVSSKTVFFFLCDAY